MSRISIYILATFAITSLLPSCKDSTEAMSVNVVVFEAIDASTGEEVNVGITVDAPMINGIAGANYIEMPLSGPYRVSWIGTATNPGTIRISAEGYQPAEIPKELVRTSFTNSSLGGTLAPETIKLTPKEEAEAGPRGD